MAHLLSAGRLDRRSAARWYSGSLVEGALPFLNKGGLTQFRLRFARDDNNDRGPDAILFASGDARSADRPVLVVEYTVP